MMDGMCLYVGIDPSLNRPGLAVLSADGKTLVATAFSVGRHTRGAARLHQNASWLTATIQSLQIDVARVCIEGPSLKSIHREFDLGEGSGVLKAAIYNYSSVEPVVVEPTRLKKFATGKPQAAKAEVLHAVKAVGGPDLGDDDDAADAYMLARLAWAFDNQSSLTRRYELEVVQSLLETKPVARVLRTKTSDNI